MKRCTILTIICLLLILTRQVSCAASWNQVKWVVDGDTAFLVEGQKVRYIGINAPELAHDEYSAEPYGEAS